MTTSKSRTMVMAALALAVGSPLVLASDRTEDRMEQLERRLHDANAHRRAVLQDLEDIGEQRVDAWELVDDLLFDQMRATTKTEYEAIGQEIDEVMALITDLQNQFARAGAELDAVHHEIDNILNQMSDFESENQPGTGTGD